MAFVLVKIGEGNGQDGYYKVLSVKDILNRTKPVTKGAEVEFFNKEDLELGKVLYKGTKTMMNALQVKESIAPPISAATLENRITLKRQSTDNVHYLVQYKSLTVMNRMAYEVIQANQSVNGAPSDGFSIGSQINFMVGHVQVTGVVLEKGRKENLEGQKKLRATLNYDDDDQNDSFDELDRAHSPYIPEENSDSENESQNKTILQRRKQKENVDIYRKLVQNNEKSPNTNQETVLPSAVLPSLNQGNVVQSSQDYAQQQGSNNRVDWTNLHSQKRLASVNQQEQLPSPDSLALNGPRPPSQVDLLSPPRHNFFNFGGNTLNSMVSNTEDNANFHDYSQRIQIGNENHDDEHEISRNYVGTENTDFQQSQFSEPNNSPPEIPQSQRDFQHVVSSQSQIANENRNNTQQRSASQLMNLSQAGNNSQVHANQASRRAPLSNILPENNSAPNAFTTRPNSLARSYSSRLSLQETRQERNDSVLWRERCKSLEQEMLQLKERTQATDKILKILQVKFPEESREVEVDANKVAVGQFTTVDRVPYSLINFLEPYSAVRDLALLVFGRETLNTHTISGRKCPTKPDAPVKPKLDAGKVSDVILHIMNQYEKLRGHLKCKYHGNDDHILNPKDLRKEMMQKTYHVSKK